MDTVRHMKVGILGGGQLGRMLLQAAANYPVVTYILEEDDSFPAVHLCHHFAKGDIKNFDDVYAFGKNLDAITIEIENVNIEALEKLEAEGVRVIPNTAVLKTIKNKILQKQFYTNNTIPTAEYILTNKKSDVANATYLLPAVHKLSTGGYDGKGVEVITDETQVHKAFDAPAVLEKMVEMEKEIAIIVAIGQDGEKAVYPAVEMIFDPSLNLLNYQLCPAGLDAEVLQMANKIAIEVAGSFGSAGLYAVELFVDKNNNVLVNETAPRVHNSGHHSIEAHYCSQFDMLWRIILGYPLGNTDYLYPSLMLNIIGEEGYSGNVVYEGLAEVLKEKNAFVHIYGKTETKPGRKMGHITLLGNDKNQLKLQADNIKTVLKVKSAS